MTVISLNIEELSAAKEDFIAKMCFKHKCSVLCLQETQRGPQSHRPKVNGMTSIAELPHDKYGNDIFVKEGTTVESIHTDDQNNIETLSVDLGSIVITSVYKPPATSFKLPPLLQRTRTGSSLEILTAIISNGDTIQQTKMATPLNNGQTVINSLWCMMLSIHLPLIVQGGKLDILAQTIRCHLEFVFSNIPSHVALIEPEDSQHILIISKYPNLRKHVGNITS